MANATEQTDKVAEWLARLPPHHRRIAESIQRKWKSGQPINRLESLWLDPAGMMETTDPWQADALRQLITHSENVLMCCCRGSGKSWSIAAAAYLEACLGGFSLILSPSDRQSKIVFSYVKEHHKRLNLVGTARELIHEMEFANGGKIISLPCSEATIRGVHRVTLLVLDEAARVPEELYAAVLPITITNQGRIALLSTPKGQRGFFWLEWNGEGRSGWRRHKYTWRECSRITPQFVADYKASTAWSGGLKVREELECEFLSASVGGFIHTEDFEFEPLGAELFV
jgi:hypothetical protein